MTSATFTTDLFRDTIFDLLSGIANDPSKFDEFVQKYLTELHQRTDGEELRRYAREIYEKILNLQMVQSSPSFRLKDTFHEKIVVVYIWASSDIHSTQMLSKIIAIDKHHSATGVTVLGVHSPKYEHEKHRMNVRNAIEEQSIGFNVINDNGLQVWKSIGCQLWPTVLIFGPDQLPLFIFEGDNHIQHVETFLIPTLNFYKSSVRATPSGSTVMKSSPEDFNANKTNTKFAYPSHICITSNGQLCISYAGSHQLIFCEVDGKVIDVVGTGHPGMADGEIQQVEFDSPHGLVEFNNCIYIADTNNHAIRVFDPNSRRVLTLIGTGRMGSDKVGGLKRSQQPLASPWCLCITESSFDHKTVLLIAMAGLHQIWAYAFEETHWWNNITLEKNSCSAIIGNGIEEHRDSSEPMSAGLAAPRGMCTGIMHDQPVLFIADSNSSSIRVVTLANGNVTNLIGGDADPKNLSAFGDLDGSGYQARLQHPRSVAFHYPSSQLYISDTFNNKLKHVDMNSGVCSSYFVTDTDTKKRRGESNSAKFNEPQGLVIFDHFMFVADKNNSHIKRIDLDKGTIVRCRFDLSETLNEERSFGSRQAYLTIFLPETVQLRDVNAGTWTIEDEDGYKVCDGELSRSASDQILLDYISRDKQVARLKYELVVCEDEKFTMLNGEIEPAQQTDSTIEFTIKIDQLETNTH